MPVTEEFVREHHEKLRPYAGRLECREFLGKGAWGSVFASDDPRWVVKITKDFEEALGCQRIMELREGHGRKQTLLLPGFADVRSVSRVDALEDDGETLYVIVRERIDPLAYGDATAKAIDEVLPVIEDARVCSVGDVALARAVLLKHAPELEISMAALARYGHRLQDLDISNLGTTIRSHCWRPAGTIVMFDLSFDMTSWL